MVEGRPARKLLALVLAPKINQPMELTPVVEAIRWALVATEQGPGSGYITVDRKRQLLTWESEAGAVYEVPYEAVGWLP